MWDSNSLYNLTPLDSGVEVANTGALVCRTGKHTGRAANDKFFVEEGSSKHQIGWGDVNRPISEARFDELLKLVQGHLSKTGTYIQYLYAGADERTRLTISLTTETAWHALAARHLLLTRSSQSKEQEGEPTFFIFHAPTFHADPEKHGTNSDAFIVIHPSKRIALIGGTGYFGEIKKSVFTMMNYLLPARGVLPMHCSANIGPEGDTAIFFGLSGTGKTTLSADGSRRLIGDDEHGWSDDGVFNFEGGCYAKTINLSKKSEPEIWRAANTWGAVIENVAFDPRTRRVDFDSSDITENGRVAYPLEFLDNVELSGMGGHPKNIVMLTCDAFGVLPPISRLTSEQAMYHFLSGYTAKVAGTEQGVTEPEATFSACFGEPFMPRPPAVYAKLLGARLQQHSSNCWLINTGWSGGPYGVGRRMEISTTRTIVREALDGVLDDVPFEPCAYFGLSVPKLWPNEDIDSTILHPYPVWDDKDAYRTHARALIEMFRKNFERFGSVPLSIKRAAPGS